MNRKVPTKVYLVRVKTTPKAQRRDEVVLYAVMAKSTKLAIAATSSRLPTGWRAFAVIPDGAPDTTIQRLALTIDEPKQFA